MKKAVLILIVMTMGLFAIAQDHVIKFNPMALSFGKVSLGYEYVLDDKKSLGLQVGIPVNTSFSDRFIEEIDTDELTILEGEYSVMSIRPSFRMYLGSNDAPRGLYFEPSIKYQSIDFTTVGTYTEPGEIPGAVEVTGGVDAFGLGLQLGAQWLIADAFSIDFFFFGPEVNFGPFNLTMKDLIGTIDLEATEMEIQNDWNDIPLIGDVETTVDLEERTVSAETDGGIFPGLRFGLNLGYAF